MNRTIFIGTNLYYSQDFVDDKDKEIERLNNIIEKIQNDMIYLDSLGVNQVKPRIICEIIELLKGEDEDNENS